MRLTNGGRCATHGGAADAKLVADEIAHHQASGQGRSQGGAAVNPISGTSTASAEPADALGSGVPPDA